jgi:hypothetical protein
VAQNQTETVNYRVTNNNASSWNIDFSPNPTLTLTRGNTYVFNLSQSFPWAFYFKTELSLGTTNVYSDGVFNNGAGTGLITFTVPQDAPDTLFYCNDVQLNLRGQINIIDGTPGTGPGFFIQSDPGVNGRVIATPNISSRDVLGVFNNGEDLGTVIFEVPAVDAQSFYYNLTSIGTIDLVTELAYDDINGQPLVDFIASTGGIDSTTNLDNRTLIFINPANTNDDWTDKGTFDFEGFDQTDQFDVSVGYEAGTTVPGTQRFDIWRIRVFPVGTGNGLIRLERITEVTAGQKVFVSSGVANAGGEYVKTAE